MRLPLALILAWGAAPGWAVTIDVGRDPLDAVVPNTAAHPYGGVGVVFGGTGFFAGEPDGCTGTPLSRRTVLTAAHCFDEGGPIRFVLPLDGRLIERGAALRLPPADEGGEAPDLAALTLGEALPPEVPLYALLDAPHPLWGQAFDMVGYGNTGTGETGDIPGSADREVKRFGRNEFERPDDPFLAGLAEDFLLADFDGGRRLAPGEPDGPDATGTEALNLFGSLGVGRLESMVGPGDSGGPAFYNPAVAAGLLSARHLGLSFGEVLDRPLVAGVASGGGSLDGARPDGAFGTLGLWTPVQPSLAWLASLDAEIEIVSGAALCAPGAACAPDLAPIPLPAGWALLLGAFGGLALLGRRAR